MQHTPGPWTLDDPHDMNPQHGRGGERVYKVVAERGGLIADVSAWWVDTQTAKANAHLVKAAPDLLDALKSVLQWADPYALPNCDRNAKDIEAAKAAIAKAEARP